MTAMTKLFLPERKMRSIVDLLEMTIAEVSAESDVQRSVELFLRDKISELMLKVEKAKGRLLRSLCSLAMTN
jgi:hypothetical protein